MPRVTAITCPCCKRPRKVDEDQIAWCPECELAYFRWTKQDEARRMAPPTTSNFLRSVA